MQSGNTFGTIELRNGIYQGQKNEFKFEGLGMFMNDDLMLHCSFWKNSLLNSHTTVFIGHAKYIYGEWQNGLPQGFNVFRSGETVLLADFQQGKILGQFAVIFQRQGFVAIIYAIENGFTLSEKLSFTNEQQLKSIITQKIFSLQQEYYSLGRYINTHFFNPNGKLEIQFANGLYNFGYENGLGVIFDDQNYIIQLGVMNSQSQLNGLGTLMTSQITQTGNFATGLVLKYPQKKVPIQGIRTLFHNEHKRSFYFYNDYVLPKSCSAMQYLEDIIHQTIRLIIQDPIDLKNDISFNKQQLDDSLQYKPRGQTQNQRLKRMSNQLKNQISLSNIKPTPIQKRNMSIYPQELKPNKIHVHSKIIVEQKSIDFQKSGKRQQFITSNKLQDYIELKSSQYRNNQTSFPPSRIVLQQTQRDSQLNTGKKSIELSSNHLPEKNNNNSKIKLNQQSILLRSSIRQSPSKQEVSTAKKTATNQKQKQKLINPMFQTDQRIEKLVQKYNTSTNTKSIVNPFKIYPINQVRAMKSEAQKKQNKLVRSPEKRIERRSTDKKSPQKKDKKASTQIKIKQFITQTQQIQYRQTNKSGRSYVEIFRKSSPKKISEQIVIQSHLVCASTKRPTYQNHFNFQQKPLMRLTSSITKPRSQNSFIESPINRHRITQQLSNKQIQ